MILISLHNGILYFIEFWTFIINYIYFLFFYERLSYFIFIFIIIIIIIIIIIKYLVEPP